MGENGASYICIVKSWKIMLTFHIMAMLKMNGKLIQFSLQNKRIKKSSIGHYNFIRKMQ